MAVNGFITAVHYLEGIGIAWVLDSYTCFFFFFFFLHRACRNETKTQLIQNHLGICELYYNFPPTLNHFVIITINVNILPSLSPVPSPSPPSFSLLYRPSAFLCEGVFSSSVLLRRPVVRGHE